MSFFLLLSSLNPVFSLPKVARYTSSSPRSLPHLPSIWFDLQLLQSFTRLFLYTFFHLPPPCHFWPFSLSLPIYFHRYCLLQYIVIIPSIHVHTILLHSPLPFYPTFSSNPTSPSAPPFSFYPLISLHTLTLPWLF